MDVKVSYSQLEYLHASLNSILDEFEQASARRSDLAADIGKPYGEGKLRDKANDFESQWDDRRNKLIEGCRSVAEHTKGVLEGFQEFDIEAAGSGSATAAG